MSDLKDAVFPFPETYIRDYAAKLGLFLRQGECVTSVWVATAGRRVVNRFILDHIELFSKDLPDCKRYLLVYIEPLDLTEETQAGYLRLIGKECLTVCKQKGVTVAFSENETKVFDDEQVPYAKLLDTLRSVVAKIINTGLEVVLLLGEFDELGFVNPTFCNNLRSLWNRFDRKLHYSFLIKDTRLIFDQNNFGEEFGYLFFQNILYVPVSKDNEDYLIDAFEEKNGRKLTADQRAVVAKMCDGHPYFIKLAMETLAKERASEGKNPEDYEVIIRANYEIRVVSSRMIEVFSDKMKKVLSEVATKQIYKLPADQETEALVSLGLVRKNPEGFYQIFCSLFRDAILKRTLPEITSSSDSQKKVYFDETANTVIVAGKPVDEQLTRQEYEILVYFIKHSNVVHSRDAIAETIWGKESYEKYSDWAIDQLMSKLRKKLGQLGVNEKYLVTVRGRGYKFVY